MPILVLTRAAGGDPSDWLPFDRGPAFFSLPADREVQVSIKNSDDEDLKKLIQEISGCKTIVSLDLSENRKITDRGLTYIQDLPHLRELDLSSCDITNSGIDHILTLNDLQRLDLRFCHRLTDVGVIKLKNLVNLIQLDLRSLPKITNGSLSKLKKRNLFILH